MRSTSMYYMLSSEADSAAYLGLGHPQALWCLAMTSQGAEAWT